MKKYRFDYYVLKGNCTLSEAWNTAYNVAREYEGPRLDLISIKATGEKEEVYAPEWKHPALVAYTFSAEYKDKNEKI